MRITHFISRREWPWSQFLAVNCQKLQFETKSQFSFTTLNTMRTNEEGLKFSHKKGDYTEPISNDNCYSCLGLTLSIQCQGFDSFSFYSMRRLGINIYCYNPTQIILFCQLVRTICRYTHVWSTEWTSESYFKRTVSRSSGLHNRIFVKQPGTLFTGSIKQTGK